MTVREDHPPVILHASDNPFDVGRGLRLCRQILEDPKCSNRVLLVINHHAITAAPDLSNEDIPSGVSVYACETALKHHSISPESLASAIRTVPSGIVFLAEQQRSKAWYIRL
ncbi:hypothetical protein [Bifidobacterium sp.]|uniref:hypothetical protein n=1 Tax=Bifidobacterium sp. TaxID=41200 RepID=UPI0039E83178